MQIILTLEPIEIIVECTPEVWAYEAIPPEALAYAAHRGIADYIQNRAEWLREVTVIARAHQPPISGVQSIEINPF